MLYLELFFQGIVQGSIYALIALGLTLVYGLLRILHVAHAALFTLGGYLGVIVTNATGSFLLATAVAMIVVGFIGIAVYKLAYEPLLSKPPFISLIASIALFIASEEIFRIIFGPYGLSYTNPPMQGYFELFGGFFLKYGEALVIVLSVVILVILGWFAAATRLGAGSRDALEELRALVTSDRLPLLRLLQSEPLQMQAFHSPRYLLKPATGPTIGVPQMNFNFGNLPRVDPICRRW